MWLLMRQAVCKSSLDRHAQIVACTSALGKTTRFLKQVLGARLIKFWIVFLKRHPFGAPKPEFEETSNGLP